ncbi:electron transfer flavoprotein alpha-subunit [Reticulomyxa filosa]|uniref:Electron transfer flavoprotein subunit alpha n=1 Tax=Reticulomyxa filosa TaxID=46433 RepID=X6N5V2_RETFI|nr:electron transfer flavoprotein alpha-subunit [Reticulomyxa filosa]|eukprot:ETO21670.1 electron transfer flavoprotein alpha-subunit [Reticulomyxa filosa]
MFSRALRSGLVCRSWSRNASTLVIAEHNNTKLSDNTRSALAAAFQIPENKVHVVVAGNECGSVAKEISGISGVSKVWVASNAKYAHQLPETLSELVVDCHKANKYTHIIAGISSFAKDVIPRVAGLLECPQISDIIKVYDANTFERAMYAGNALCRVRSTGSTTLLTCRPTAFGGELKTNAGQACEVVDLKPTTATDGTLRTSTHVSDEVSAQRGPSLTKAGVIVSGGRGMQASENFKILYELADTIGDCAVGASRAAVDSGFVPNDLQIGQTGKVVAPNLYIAVGISGAIQHIAGMKDSKTVIAINKDKEAPIFAVADYGLVADLFQAVPQLTKMIKANKQK